MGVSWCGVVVMVMVVEMVCERERMCVWWVAVMVVTVVRERGNECVYLFRLQGILLP